MLMTRPCMARRTSSEGSARSGPGRRSSVFPGEAMRSSWRAWAFIILRDGDVEEERTP